ncbi:MAG: hypothetical protein C4520_20230 [Candidatus Abyssobacteria bacterium SURF_5]|uniref:Response regulator n=1 Tax=Abyssobacteria bacterium (strain SURF_5) TaxID=2093360 RepID=A0A3A4MZ99_ABYX5|nr:MAG: hypothetical protein C4520_20230 [Candidatus Abyssubacteria bacterium SURF_5]
MNKALVCQIDADVSAHLKQEMKRYGWSIDACDGMLEMLRLLETNDYDLVVLNATARNVEIHTRLGAIKALDKNPRIILNLAESENYMPSSLIIEFPVIKGTLTTAKLLDAVHEIPG